MMSPYLAYLLGVLTVLIIVVTFWVLSARFKNVSDVYQSIFCDQTIP